MPRSPLLSSAPIDAPAQGYAAVTPHDTNPLPVAGARGLYVGVGGDISLISPQGDTVLFKGVPTGAILPVAANVVRATGTTATDIVALY